MKNQKPLSTCLSNIKTIITLKKLFITLVSPAFAKQVRNFTTVFIVVDIKAAIASTAGQLKFFRQAFAYPYRRTFSIMSLTSSEDFSKVPNLFLKWIGRSTNNIGGTSDRSYYKNSIIFYTLLISLTVVIGQESGILYIDVAKSIQTDLLECTLLVLCIGYSSIAVVKMFALVVNNGLVSSLIYRLYDIYPKTAKTQRQYNAIDYLTKSNRITKTYSLLYVIMIVFFALCFSLAQTYQDYATTGVWKLQLPYAHMIWYPFDENHGIGFYFALVQQYVAAYFAAFGIVAADTLLLCIVMQVSMHFEELKNRFHVLRLERGDLATVVMKELTVKHIQIIG